jgi:hypothetical protein
MLKNQIIADKYDMKYICRWVGKTALLQTLVCVLACAVCKCAVCVVGSGFQNFSWWEWLAFFFSALCCQGFVVVSYACP